MIDIGVTIARNDYYIDAQWVEQNSSVLTGAVDDKLVVTYEMNHASFTSVKDRNLWTSPVTNYSVSFKKSQLCALAISKVVGKRSLGVRTSDTGEFVVFDDELGGLTAQGFEWTLSRIKI